MAVVFGSSIELMLTKFMIVCPLLNGMAKGMGNHQGRTAGSSSSNY